MNKSGQEDIDRAYDSAWDAFVAGAKVEPAFTRWPSDTTLHLVFLCPVGTAPKTIAPILPLQQRLAFPYADLVPPERFHVSIQAFDVKLAEWREHRHEVLGPARKLFAQVPAFTIRLGWLNSFSMAAFLRAEDGGVIRRLRAELRRVLPAWTGLDSDPLVRDGVDGWLPHLSLAYYNAVHDNRALVEAIVPSREGVIVDAQVNEVHLISTPPNLTDADRWQWPLHGVFPLQGA